MTKEGITREKAITNLYLIMAAFIRPVTKEQMQLIIDTFRAAIQALEQETTKEEAALLQKWRDNRGISIEDFEDAMYALQEPCTDAVSRKAALNSLIDNTHLDGYYLAEALDAIENKEKLPSVNPQNERNDI